MMNKDKPVKQFYCKKHWNEALDLFNEGATGGTSPVR